MGSSQIQRTADKVVSDQSFDTVELPEFQDLLNYVHQPAPTLNIPGRNVIKRHVMSMGDCAIEETKAMFA
ncbi:hypothetical protein C0991_010085, partial [Blastosporella zonata]